MFLLASQHAASLIFSGHLCNSFLHKGKTVKLNQQFD
jgi:hypothetical protein